MPVTNLRSSVAYRGGRSSTKQMHIASVLLSAVCLSSVAEAVVRDASSRSSRSAGHACNFLRGCQPASHSAEPEPTEGSRSIYDGNKTFDMSHHSANHRELTNISVHVDGDIILTDNQRDVRFGANAEVSNAALNSNVTCDEGVVCNSGVIDNKKSFSSIMDVPHAINVSTCNITKWVQLDLQALYMIRDVALFWPYNTTSPRKYCSLRLDVSQDGLTWAVIYDNLGEFSRKSDGNGFWLTIPENQSEARFVRWYSSRSDVSPSVEFAEMQVFGTAVASEIASEKNASKEDSKNQTQRGNYTIKILPADKYDDSGEDASPPWRGGYGHDTARAPASAPPAFPPEERAMMG